MADLLMSSGHASELRPLAPETTLVPYIIRLPAVSGSVPKSTPRPIVKCFCRVSDYCWCPVGTSEQHRFDTGFPEKDA